MKSKNFEIEVEARVKNTADFVGGETIAKSAVTRTVAGVNLADTDSQAELEYEITQAFEAVQTRLAAEVDAQARLESRAAEAANSAAHAS